MNTITIYWLFDVRNIPVINIISTDLVVVISNAIMIKMKVLVKIMMIFTIIANSIIVITIIFIITMRSTKSNPMKIRKYTSTYYIINGIVAKRQVHKRNTTSWRMAGQWNYLRHILSRILNHSHISETPKRSLVCKFLCYN